MGVPVVFSAFSTKLWIIDASCDVIDFIWSTAFLRVFDDVLMTITTVKAIMAKTTIAVVIIRLAVLDINLHSLPY